MPDDAIKYAVHKMRPEAGRPSDSKVTGRFTVALDNLTKAEAADVLLLLTRMQVVRAAGQEWT